MDCMILQEKFLDVKFYNFRWERSPRRNSCFFGVSLSSISEPCAIILDTKSNLEPIVQTPNDAIRTFYEF
jgi:hypothetical protein